MLSTEQIKERVEQAISESHVQVEDMTGSGDHFKISVVSAAFEGKSLVQRHRMVYAALGQDVGGAIHAAALSTLTPSETNS